MAVREHGAVVVVGPLQAPAGLPRGLQRYPGALGPTGAPRGCTGLAGPYRPASPRSRRSHITRHYHRYLPPPTSQHCTCTASGTDCGTGLCVASTKPAFIYTFQLLRTILLFTQDCYSRTNSVELARVSVSIINKTRHSSEARPSLFSTRAENRMSTREKHQKLVCFSDLRVSRRAHCSLVTSRAIHFLLQVIGQVEDGRVG